MEGLSERELTSPEGAGFDLRLGEVYKISGNAFLGVNERKTAEIKLVAKYSLGAKMINQPHAGSHDRDKKREAK